MKKVFRIILLVIIIGAFGATIYFLYQKSKSEPVVYETENAVIKDIIKKTVATGTVVPRKEIEIKPQVSGIIEEVYLEPGDIVKNGDLIAKVRIIPNMINLNNAEARLDQAEIDYEDAKLVYDRQKMIFDEGVIPAAEFQQYEISLNRAKSELNSAENNLQLIKEGVTKDSESSTNTLIRSTIVGMVLDVPVEQGNSVIESNTFNAGTTIAVIADMGEMIFEGKVDETEVGKIKTGMNLLLTIGAIEETEFNAYLEYISPKGIEENGAIQFEIKAAVELKKDYFIRAGYSANADIVLTRKDSVLSVKESLLIFEEDSVFVEIETEPQIYEKRLVEVGLSDGINIEVLAGITEEDKIKVPQ
ncbi:efflux RND transporter periplasmic adaptor subunit [Bacteroidota bacterium]